MLVTFLLYAFAVSAVTLLITVSTAAEKPKQFLLGWMENYRVIDNIPHLFNCPLCMSFWISLAVTYWLYPTYATVHTFWLHVFGLMGASVWFAANTAENLRD